MAIHEIADNSIKTKERRHADSISACLFHYRQTNALQSMKPERHLEEINRRSSKFFRRFIFANRRSIRSRLRWLFCACFSVWQYRYSDCASAIKKGNESLAFLCIVLSFPLYRQPVSVFCLYGRLLHLQEGYFFLIEKSVMSSRYVLLGQACEAYSIQLFHLVSQMIEHSADYSVLAGV